MGALVTWVKDVRRILTRAALDIAFGEAESPTYREEFLRFDPPPGGET